MLRIGFSLEQHDVCNLYPICSCYITVVLLVCSLSLMVWGLEKSESTLTSVLACMLVSLFTPPPPPRNEKPRMPPQFQPDEFKNFHHSWFPRNKPKTGPKCGNMLQPHCLNCSVEVIFVSCTKKNTTLDRCAPFFMNF